MHLNKLVAMSVRLACKAETAPVQFIALTAKFCGPILEKFGFFPWLSATAESGAGQRFDREFGRTQNPN